MAITRTEHVDDESDDLMSLSQESDFYGDEATKKEYAERSNNFDVASWWNNKTPSLTEIANKNLANKKEVKSVKLYNIYEGIMAGRQLTETVDEFLRRLPPRTTEQSATVPWIYITNPYIPRTSRGNVKKEKLSDEGPEEEGRDTMKFTIAGQQLLEDLDEQKKAIENELRGKAPSTISAAFRKRRDETVKEICKAAVEMKCISGKWLLFTPPESVNEVWACVARATTDNVLGIGAKVSPYQAGQRGSDRVICIYTKNFEDKDDIGRVVKKMRELGLVDTRGKPIYYKCDAYTYLDIKRDNPYGIKPSLYSSAEFLQGRNKKGDTNSTRKLGDIMY